MKISIYMALIIATAYAKEKPYEVVLTNKSSNPITCAVLGLSSKDKLIVGPSKKIDPSAKREFHWGPNYTTDRVNTLAKPFIACPPTSLDDKGFVGFYAVIPPNAMKDGKHFEYSVGTASQKLGGGALFRVIDPKKQENEQIVYSGKAEYKGKFGQISNYKADYQKWAPENLLLQSLGVIGE